MADLSNYSVRMVKSNPTNPELATHVNNQWDTNSANSDNQQSIWELGELSAESVDFNIQ